MKLITIYRGVISGQCKGALLRIQIGYVAVFLFDGLLRGWAGSQLGIFAPIKSDTGYKCTGFYFQPWLAPDVAVCQLPKWYKWTTRMFSFGYQTKEFDIMHLGRYSFSVCYHIMHFIVSIPRYIRLASQRIWKYALKPFFMIVFLISPMCRLSNYVNFRTTYNLQEFHWFEIGRYDGSDDYFFGLVLAIFSPIWYPCLLLMRFYHFCEKYK